MKEDITYEEIVDALDNLIYCYMEQCGENPAYIRLPRYLFSIMSMYTFDRKLTQIETINATGYIPKYKGIPIDVYDPTDGSYIEVHAGGKS